MNHQLTRSTWLSLCPVFPDRIREGYLLYYFSEASWKHCWDQLASYRVFNKLIISARGLFELGPLLARLFAKMAVIDRSTKAVMCSIVSKGWPLLTFSSIFDIPDLGMIFYNGPDIALSAMSPGSPSHESFFSVGLSALSGWPTRLSARKPRRRRSESSTPWAIAVRRLRDLRYNNLYFAKETNDNRRFHARMERIAFRNIGRSRSRDQLKGQKPMVMCLN